MPTRWHKCLGGCSLASGLLILISGILFFCLLPMVVKKKVENDIGLRPGSLNAKTWQDPPFNVSMQFWIFNVTNPADILFNGSKPSLFQKGPYGFREVQHKRRVVFSPNGSISYMNEKFYYFEPRLSCPTCFEDDEFTVPNIPYLTILKMIRSQTAGKEILEFGIRLFLRLIGEHPFVVARARQLLFEGYKDKLFDFVNKIKPGSLPERMGLFYGKNATTDGVYEIRSGVDDPYSIGKILSWDWHRNLLWKNWWNPNYTQASMINGTDGTLYPPFVKRTDKLPMFVREICRSLYITYKSDVDFYGLKAYRFGMPPEVFSPYEPENRGFCVPSQERFYSEDIQPRLNGGWCLPAGMLDVSVCNQGGPIVITSPQFVFCPDEVVGSVDGLYSFSEDFLTNVDIEPNTGVILSASRKVQLNVEMYADPEKIQVFQNMKGVIVPIVWLNESVSIDKPTKDFIYKNVVTLQHLAYVSSYVLMGVGAGLVVAVIVIFGVCTLYKKRREVIGASNSAFVDDHSTQSNSFSSNA